MNTAVKQSSIPTYNLFNKSEEWPIRELVHHEYIQQRCAEADGQIKTHRHLDLFHMLYLFSGSAQVVLDDKTYTIHAPILVTVPALSVHGFRPLESVHGHLLTLPGSSLGHILKYAETDIEFHSQSIQVTGRCGEKIRELDDLFRQLAREYRHPENQSRFIALQSIIRLIFVWIIRHQNNTDHHESFNDRDSARIRKFKGDIEIHFREGRSIKDYASQLGISSAQLNNICRSKVGKSALQIVHERITLEAKRSLVYTSLTISEIAYDLGFTDPAYFTRFFSKQTGSSPKHFRTNHRPQAEMVEPKKALISEA